jgi:competence protein ComGC
MIRAGPSIIMVLFAELTQAKQVFINLTGKNIMKLLILFFLLILCIPSLAQGKKHTYSSGGAPSLSLRGQINSFEITEDSTSSDFLAVKLTVQFVNTGKTPILLLNAGPISSGGLDTEPRFLGATLAKNADGESLTSIYVGPNLDLSPKWVIMRSILNQNVPSPDKIYVLMPNEIMTLEASIGLDLPRKPENFGYTQKASLKQILDASPVWLKVHCEVWPLNLEPASGKNKLKKRFGHQLRQKWKRFGHLWLDDIDSEPILLDLKSKAN